MVSACVLVCCNPGRFNEVAGTIRNISGVKRAFGAIGRWDVIFEVEASDLKTLRDVVMNVHDLPGVRVTETLVEVSL